MAHTEQKKQLVYLSRKRCLFIGYMPEKIRTTQASPVLLINLSGSFDIPTPAGVVCSRTLLLPAGETAEFIAHDNLIADLMLDPLSGDFERVKTAMSSVYPGMYINLRQEQCIVDLMQNIYDREYEIDEVIARLRRHFCRLAPLDKKPTIDPRVEHVVTTISTCPFKNQSVADLAKSTNLSIPRLVELFKRDMGVPISKYRIWRRLFTAALTLANSSNLTDAAHAAGFCDSSHYSKKFKDMFGVSPKHIFGSGNDIILKCEQPPSRS
ncbi:MAG: AraC family transcriptional regulator [Oleiphilaceae bacterium]|nr:AraC family transcriptional regulator [Oleiphilaceae bacterium]